MKRLSRPGFERAASFIRNEGRRLERRLFDLHFSSGSVEAVIDALAAYQNPDGGFGRALEPDIQTPASSSRATTVGLQVLREICAPSGHPVVRSAIGYLVAHFDAEGQCWPLVPPEVDRAPHAPWWDFEGNQEAFHGSRLNPTAEALACLWDYPAGVPKGLTGRLTQTVLERVEASPDNMEMHDLQCCIHLADTASLPAEVRSRLVEKLGAAADATVSRDPSKWVGYTLTPLGAVFGPASCLAARFKADLPANLAFEIDRQGEDGVWSPPWSWGDRYPGDWPGARRQWQSALTMSTLKALSDFGCVESS